MALFGWHESGRRGRRRPRGPWRCNWFESRAAKGRDIELVAMATQRRERRPQPSGHLLQFILSIERMVPAARYLICIYTHRQTCFKMLRASPRGPQGQRQSASEHMPPTPPPPHTLQIIFSNQLGSFQFRCTRHRIFRCQLFAPRQMSFAPGRVVLQVSRLHIATKWDWGAVGFREIVNHT